MGLFSRNNDSAPDLSEGSPLSDNLARRQAEQHVCNTKGSYYDGEYTYDQCTECGAVHW